MRSLRITLHTPKPIVLPLAYNELLQGLLYSCWRERYGSLHDAKALDGRDLRPFTFGMLEGRSSVDAKRKTIRFDGLLSFEVRSPIEELIDACIVQLSSRKAVEIGAHKLELANLQANDRLYFQPQAVVAARTPIVAYQTGADGHTIPFSPLDEEWLPLIQQNARRKAGEFGAKSDLPLQVVPVPKSLRKRVTRFKGTYVTGWTGRFVLLCDPQLMSLLWCLGLGAKNSQGFGLFDILDAERL